MTFVNKLAQNIRKICSVKFEEMDIQIDRIFIPFSEENLNNLNYVYGISSFSPVIELDSNMDSIESFLKKIDLSSYSTFKMNCRRKWKDFPKNSLELNNYFGGTILKNNNISVKVKDPDIEINIEIHKNFSYIFWIKNEGLGGLPVGISGKTIHLLSGGIDSPVAALEMIKRGVKIGRAHFWTPVTLNNL